MIGINLFGSNYLLLLEGMAVHPMLAGVHLGVCPIWISLDIVGYLWILLDIIGYHWILLDMKGYLLDIFGQNRISFRHIQEKISTQDIQEISKRYPEISKPHIDERYPLIHIQENIHAYPNGISTSDIHDISTKVIQNISYDIQ